MPLKQLDELPDGDLFPNGKPEPEIQIYTTVKNIE